MSSSRLVALVLSSVAVLVLSNPGLSEEYRWPGPVPDALIAPTDSNGLEIHGASLQGGLIDLRYGQASIDVGGAGVILDWNDSTIFTLNGASTDAAALANLVVEGTGLKVALRYDPKSGLIGWCDAVDSASVPAVNVTLKPWKAILTPDETLSIRIDATESHRLELKSPTLLIPGMVHGLTFHRAGKSGWQTEVPIQRGWNWKNLPLFITTQDGRTLRGKSLSVSSTGPTIGRTGPRVASEHLSSIPGWLELEGNLMFIDPSSIQLSASEGARVTQIFPRHDRIDFTIEVLGSGTYQVQATIADLIGREARKTWSFTVRR